jgi:hypothetical protein
MSLAETADAAILAEPIVPAKLAMNGSAHRNSQRHFHGVLLASAAAVLLLSFVLTVRDHSQVVLPLIGRPLPELCSLRRFTGLACPGCGLTRSFISIAHGDFRAAWTYNPAGLLLFAVVAAQVPFRGYQLWRIGHRRAELLLPYAAEVLFAAVGVALLLQWSLRLAGLAF